MEDELSWASGDHPSEDTDVKSEPQDVGLQIPETDQNRKSLSKDPFKEIGVMMDQRKPESQAQS